MCERVRRCEKTGSVRPTPRLQLGEHARDVRHVRGHRVGDGRLLRGELERPVEVREVHEHAADVRHGRAEDRRRAPGFCVWRAEPRDDAGAQGRGVPVAGAQDGTQAEGPRRPRRPGSPQPRRVLRGRTWSSTDSRLGRAPPCGSPCTAASVRSSSTRPLRVGSVCWRPIGPTAARARASGNRSPMASAAPLALDAFLGSRTHAAADRCMPP